jgi:predicted TIM-barrel fold metal-dependent hydrolase
MAVSDAHVHFFSRRFFEALAKQCSALEPRNISSAEGVAQAVEWELPAADPRELAKRWADELDDHDVSRAALIASVPGDEGSVTAAAEAQTGRFFAYAMFNPLEPDAAARAEFAFRCGIKALCLFPAMHLFSMHDERIAPVLEVAASQPHRAIFVHCGVLTVGARKKLGLASPYDMRYSNPLDLHSIALRYPKLPFIVPHFGAGYFREALMLADLCPNVYLDTSSSNSWTGYEELNLPAVFRRALAVVGPGRLLFGTDSSFFPRGWNQAIFDQQCLVLHSLDVGTADARLILSENLENLFGAAALSQ